MASGSVFLFCLPNCRTVPTGCRLRWRVYWGVHLEIGPEVLVERVLVKSKKESWIPFSEYCSANRFCGVRPKIGRKTRYRWFNGSAWYFAIRCTVSGCMQLLYKKKPNLNCAIRNTKIGDECCHFANILCSHLLCFCQVNRLTWSNTDDHRFINATLYYCLLLFSCLRCYERGMIGHSSAANSKVWRYIGDDWYGVFPTEFTILRWRVKKVFWKNFSCFNKLLLLAYGEWQLRSFSFN